MQYVVRVLVLAVAAAVVITVCQRHHSGRRSRQVGVHQESGQGRSPTLSQKVEAGNQPRGNPGTQVGEVPKAGNESKVSQRPPADQASRGADHGKEPPLLLEDEPLPLADDGPPLLLAPGGEGALGPAGPVADNSRCHHCHLNYVDEDLAVVHAEANIGCADCHGNCDAHIADESWASGGNGTPPEIMYPLEKINPCCLECHPEDELSRLEHGSFFAGTSGERFCTGCHGDHRLAVRKCKWK